jgi:hypothetical protein
MLNKNKFAEFICKHLQIYQRIIYGLNVALLLVIAPFAYFVPKTFEGTHFCIIIFLC